MHLEILVEEPSAEEALSLLIPKIVGDKASFAIHSFGDKQTLLREIGSRLKAYAQWMPADWRIVVLVDRDDDDCLKLKAKLELAAKDAGLPSKTVASRKDRVRVINRIAVEELEAWFFGDVQALTTAYPKISLNLIKKAAYRDADAIRGGTWEALERVLQKEGYFVTGLRKKELARTIAAAMCPERNTSHSFCAFRDAIIQLVS